jgi:hypothetical protein
MKTVKTINRLKQAIKEVAYEKRLNMTQIKGLMRLMGVSNLHINPLVCARCGKCCSEVNEYNTCDNCVPLMKKAEKQVRKTQLPTYQEDFKYHYKSSESQSRTEAMVQSSYNAVISRRLV